MTIETQFNTVMGASDFEIILKNKRRLTSTYPHLVRINLEKSLEDEDISGICSEF